MKTRLYIIFIIIFFGTITNLDAKEVRLYTAIPLQPTSEVKDKRAERTIEILDCLFDRLPGYHFKASHAVWKRVLSDAQNYKIDGWFGYMDNKGLNVGQSDETSDYWQGDEAKFKKTFHVSLKKPFIDDIVYDGSSQRFQSQVSLTIIDPVDDKPIGAITVGIDVEMALTSQ